MQRRHDHGQCRRKSRLFLGGPRQRTELLRRRHALSPEAVSPAAGNHGQCLLLSLRDDRRHRRVARAAGKRVAKQCRAQPVGSRCPVRVWRTRRGSSNGKVALVTATMFADSVEEARSTLAMLEGCPLIDRCLSKSVAQPTTFEALFDASGALWPPDLRSKVDALFYNRPLAEVVAATKDHIQAAPSPKTVFMLPSSPARRGRRQRLPMPRSR